MNACYITMILILTTILIWIGFDIYTFIHNGNVSTISVIFANWNHYFPGVGVLFGILIGHLFFNQTEKLDINEKP